MPRKYIGPFNEAMIRHPITGQWVVVHRDEPTADLDDIGDIDLGPEWVDLTPPAPPAQTKAAKADTAKEGDQ